MKGVPINYIHDEAKKELPSCLAWNQAEPAQVNAL
jgi:hypothetical protein